MIPAVGRRANPALRPLRWAAAPLTALWPCAIALGLSAGCASAPLVQIAGEGGLSPVEGVTGTRSVDVVTGDGQTLRGVHVPLEDEDALLVLHLLPSGASVPGGLPMGIGRVGLGPTLAALAEAGFASLVLDYRGVGDSVGRVRSERLLEDGRAMWRHALELVGGREDRVVLRAVSLGTLIVADLLDGGASPAAVILHAPVRSRTIVRNAARARSGAAAGRLASFFLRAPRAPDLAGVLARTTAPALVFLAEEDEYLPAPESQALITAAEGAGHPVIVRPGDHTTVVLRAWGFTLDPTELSGRATPELQAEELHLLRGARGRAPRGR